MRRRQAAKNLVPVEIFLWMLPLSRCDYSAPIEEVNFNKEDYAADFNWEQTCPICGSEMKVRHGRYGAFLGCTALSRMQRDRQYSQKRGSASSDRRYAPLPGHRLSRATWWPRKSRFGKIFYSCSTFPDCDVIVNQLEQLATKYPNHPRTPYQKKEKKGKGKAPLKAKAAGKTKIAAKAAKSDTKTTKTSKAAKTTKTAKGAEKTKKPRIMPALKLSPELAAITGVPELGRGEVMKKVWDYIKAKGLQDETNKRIIHPDLALGKVFGSNEPVDMFKIAGLLTPHLLK